AQRTSRYKPSPSVQLVGDPANTRGGAMLNRYRGAISRAAIVICCFLAPARSAAAQATFVQSAGGNDHYNTVSASASFAAAVGAANAVTSGTITTTAGGDYVVGFTFNDSGNQADWTAGTGYTRRQDFQVASYTAASEDRTQATAGAIAATFTATAATFGDFLT